jgi:hypothetical protein
MAAKILIQGSFIRATYGVLAMLFPKLLLAGAGLSESKVGNEGRYFNRLFGGRDLLVAVGTVAAVRGGAEEKAVTANLACELTDSIALIEELRSRGGIDRTLAVGLAFNVAGYATWLRALAARGR